MSQAKYLPAIAGLFWSFGKFTQRDTSASSSGSMQVASWVHCKAVLSIKCQWHDDKIDKGKYAQNVCFFTKGEILICGPFPPCMGVSNYEKRGNRPDSQKSKSLPGGGRPAPRSYGWAVRWRLKVTKTSILATWEGESYGEIRLDTNEHTYIILNPWKLISFGSTLEIHFDNIIFVGQLHCLVPPTQSKSSPGPRVHPRTRPGCHLRTSENMCWKNQVQCMLWKASSTETSIYISTWLSSTLCS